MLECPFVGEKCPKVIKYPIPLEVHDGFEGEGQTKILTSPSGEAYMVDFSKATTTECPHASIGDTASERLYPRAGDHIGAEIERGTAVTHIGPTATRACITPNPWQ